MRISKKVWERFEDKLTDYQMAQWEAEARLKELLPGKWKLDTIEERIFVLGKLCGKAEHEIGITELFRLIETWKEELKPKEAK